jgi:hypothetical protein
MRKEHFQYLVIALGVLAPVAIVLYSLRSEDKLDPPGVLEQKVLNAASTAERIDAAKGLICHGPAARREVRRALAQSRQNDPEVRACLLQATMAIRDWRSLPEIFAAMGDSDTTIRGRAGAAAQQIMGADFQFRAADPSEKRAAILTVMRREYDLVKARYPEFYPEQEE